MKEMQINSTINDTDTGLQCPRHCGWNETNSHRLPSPVEEKGQRPLSQEESDLTLALTGLYCFSGHITMRMVLIYYAQFALGGYLLQKTKERMLLIPSKNKDICKCKGKSG